ncbi:MAG: ECF-type sigma factor [Oceanococcaceae bacterium]
MRRETDTQAGGGSVVLSESVQAELDRDCPPDLAESVHALLPLHYDQLKRIARRERGRLQPFSTLNTTAVVHEAYLRLHGDKKMQSHEHFLRTSVIAMRYVIIDRVREQLAAKRGGGQMDLPLDAIDEASFTVENDTETLAVHEALHRLKDVSPRLAEVAECRYFGGYTDSETAEALGTSLRTVRRDWAVAKAWLARELDTSDRAPKDGEPA